MVKGLPLFLAALLLAPNACSRPTLSQKKNKSQLAVYIVVSSPQVLSHSDYEEKTRIS